MNKKRLLYFLKEFSTLIKYSKLSSIVDLIAFILLFPLGYYLVINQLDVYNVIRAVSSVISGVAFFVTTLLITLIARKFKQRYLFYSSTFLIVYLIIGYFVENYLYSLGGEIASILFFICVIVFQGKLNISKNLYRFSIFGIIASLMIIVNLVLLEPISNFYYSLGYAIFGTLFMFYRYKFFSELYNKIRKRKTKSKK